MSRVAERGDISETAASFQPSACTPISSIIITAKTVATATEGSFGADELLQALEEEECEAQVVQRVQYLVNPEITEAVLNCVDVERLKICRLICRTWNEEASRILRSKGCVFLDRLEEFTDFQSILEERKILLPAPFPFSGVALSNIQSDSLLSVVEKLQEQSLHVTRLSFLGYGLIHGNRSGTSSSIEENGRTLSTVLGKCAKNLISLSLSTSPTLNLPKSLSFPTLKCLRILEKPNSPGDSTLEQESHTKLLGFLFSSAPNLTQLQVSGARAPKVVVETWEDLEKLEYIWLKYDSASYPEDILTPMIRDREREWRLKRFTFITHKYSSTRTDASISQLFLQVVAKFSPFIKEIWFQFPGNLSGTFPHCPNLTHLKLQSFELESLDFSSLTGLEHLVQGQVPVAAAVEEAPGAAGEIAASSILPFSKPLKRFCSIAHPKEYVPSACYWFRKFSLAFPDTRAWVVNLLNLPAFTELVLCKEIAARSLCIDLDRTKSSQIKALLDSLKLIPDLEKLGLGNSTRKRNRRFKPSYIPFHQLRNLKIISFDYPGYDNMMEVIDELKRFERIVIYGVARGKADRLQDILIQLPAALVVPRQPDM